MSIGPSPWTVGQQARHAPDQKSGPLKRFPAAAQHALHRIRRFDAGSFTAEYYVRHPDHPIDRRVGVRSR